MKFVIIVIALMLAACAHNDSRTETVYVDVLVPIPCTTPTPKPPILSFEQLNSTDDLFAKVRALLSDRLLQQGYIVELDSVIASCR